MKISTIWSAICVLAFTLSACSTQPKQNHTSDITSVQNQLNQIDQGNFGQFMSEMQNSKRQIDKAQSIQDVLRNGDLTDGTQQAVEAQAAARLALSHRNKAEQSLNKILQPMRNNIKNNSSRLGYLENLHVKAGTKIPTVNLFFDSGSHRLSLEEKKKLLEIVNFLKKYPVFAIRLRAFADSIGNKRRNLILAKKRNKTVLNLLRGHGLPDSTIISIASGESSGPDEIKNIYNRRVEITPYVHGRYASTAKNEH